MKVNPWTQGKSSDPRPSSTAASTPTRSNPWRAPSSLPTPSESDSAMRAQRSGLVHLKIGGASKRSSPPSTRLETSFRSAPRPWAAKPYQEIGLRDLLAHSRRALWFDPGLGKTATTLAAFSVLKAQGLVSRMMVVAPVRVAEMVWPAEVQKWQDFSHLRVVVLRGHGRERLFAENADIYVVNWESLKWLAKAGHEAKFQWPEMWVLDEATYAKNHNSDRFAALTARERRRGLCTYRR